jgi:uncharacterized membrane protein YhaH (DUF805 family)
VGRFAAYLSFDGRANRQRYWLTSLAVAALLGVGAVVVSLMSVAATVLAVLLVPLFLLYLWIVLAVGARRLHDREKSAWWLMVFQGVPILLSALRGLMILGTGNEAAGPGALLGLIGLGFSIWGFVELGFLKGTAGPNRFGPDPLASPMQEVFA